MNPPLTLPKFARNKIGLGEGVIPSVPVAVPRIATPEVPKAITPKFITVRSPVIANVPTPVRTSGIVNVPSPVRTPVMSPTRTPVPPVPSPIRSPAIAVYTGQNAPKSPLYIPRIGIAKGVPKSPALSPTLSTEENPWLPARVEGAGEVKITAITPIGTIAMVPTCDKRPPPTPRRLPQTPNRNLTLRVIDEHTGMIKIDPLLTAAIYLDCTKPEDQDYNHVAERMRGITQTTTILQKQYKNSFQPLVGISGRTTVDTFERVLAIYENNQVYYQDRLDDKTLTLEQIRQGLNTLERWLACIIEPKPRDNDDIESWREREDMKINKGVTGHCDPDLYQYIYPFDTELKAQIRKLQV